MFEFKRYQFYNLKKFINSKQAPDLIQELVIDSVIMDNFEITDVSSTQYSRKNSIIFINKNFKNDFNLPKSVLLITDNEYIFKDNKFKNKIFVKNLDTSFIKLINFLFIHDDANSYEDNFILKDGSYISNESKIHSTAIIGKNCVIGKGVEIGKNCLIKNNVVIKNAILKDDIIISDNTVIGSSGFGFNLKDLGAKNIIPQIGIVLIDDNVHIGSNCTVDRGKIDFTYIGSNSVIDNMVHIAHNVCIESRACIAAQTGISGSTNIGKNLICGGQVGFAGHINIGDNVIVAAKSGVTKNISSNSTIAGFPAIDIKEWKRKIILEKKNGYKWNSKNTPPSISVSVNW